MRTDTEIDARCLVTLYLPVKDTTRMSLCFTMASPAPEPSPQTKLTTPVGNPVKRDYFARVKRVRDLLKFFLLIARPGMIIRTCFMKQFHEHPRGDCRHLWGFADDGVARHQGRPELECEQCIIGSLDLLIEIMKLSPKIKWDHCFTNAQIFFYNDTLKVSRYSGRFQGAMIPATPTGPRVE